MAGWRAQDQRRPALSEAETPFCSPVTRPKTDQKTVDAPRARSCRSRSCAWHFQVSPGDAAERASLRAGGGVRTRGWTAGAGAGLRVGKGPRCSQRSDSGLEPRKTYSPCVPSPGAALGGRQRGETQPRYEAWEVDCPAMSERRRWPGASQGSFPGRDRGHTASPQEASHAGSHSGRTAPEQAACGLGAQPSQAENENQLGPMRGRGPGDELGLWLAPQASQRSGLEY